MHFLNTPDHSFLDWGIFFRGSCIVASRVQSVSFRDALFHRMMAGRPGFRLAEVMCDVVHPNALGHR